MNNSYFAFNTNSSLRSVFRIQRQEGKCASLIYKENNVRSRGKTIVAAHVWSWVMWMFLLVQEFQESLWHWLGEKVANKWEERPKTSQTTSNIVCSYRNCCWMPRKLVACMYVCVRISLSKGFCYLKAYVSSWEDDSFVILSHYSIWVCVAYLCLSSAFLW